MNLDTDAKYKKDYEGLEDYLLNLPNYKDVLLLRGIVEAVKQV